MFVAFDDTDSKEWMCTTFLATEIIDALRELDLIGMPRLVRLESSGPMEDQGERGIMPAVRPWAGTGHLSGRDPRYTLFLLSEGGGGGGPRDDHGALLCPDRKMVPGAGRCQPWPGRFIQSPLPTVLLGGGPGHRRQGRRG